MCVQSQIPQTIVLDFHGEPWSEEGTLEFRLIYSGKLLGASKNNTRANHKHEIRRALQPQLLRLWQTNDNIRDYARLLGAKAHFYDPNRDRSVTYAQKDQEVSIGEGIWLLANKFSRCGYNFVPLITEELALRCNIEILFLRPEKSGQLINSGDIDNRIKTLFDAFRVPANCAELANAGAATPDETPFYCLVEDDRLISEVKITTDQLLLLPGERELSPNDAFVVVTVKIKPNNFSMEALRFI